MKSKIFKFVVIFFLFFSMFRTGQISKFLNDVNLYLFGGTYFWIIIIIILFLINSFFKENIRNYFRKYLIAVTLAGISVELIYTLIKVNINYKLDYDFFVNQTVFSPDNIKDKIGFIQSFFEISVNTLFGNLGIFVIAFILFVIAIFLILDIDSFFRFIGRTIKNMYMSIFSDGEEYEEEEIEDKTIDLNSLKQEKTMVRSRSKTTTPSKKKKFDDVKIEQDGAKTQNTLKVRAISPKRKKTISKSNNNVMFEPPKHIGNKDIISTAKKSEKIVSTGLEGKTSKIDVNDEEVEVSIKDNVDVIGLKGNKKYKVPSTSLLSNITNNNESYKQLKMEAKGKAKLLLDTLESFKVKAQMRNIVVGSSITRYEIQPEAGQKVSKFSSLNNDLAMALSAESIRIEAPIPGKPLVGIEVPNAKRLTVGLKEIIKPNVYDKNNKLKIALGKDIEGKIRTLDIAKAPHLLVAGATGSGKSVCINTIIVSILFNATPEEVKFLLIDPKKVELTPYDGIPHLLSPVITDPEKAAVALNKLVYEMENRYNLFAETKTRNIESYNKIAKEEKLPYIVAIIDELADLMMVSSTEVEVSISRIAQKARAAGIHLILATQRPSTDVITGLIKSNIPTRISFSVSSSIDSRTILDKTGAEKLLGNGDMLLSANGSSNLLRIQGAYLSDEEIQKVVSYIDKQFSKEDIDEYYEDEFLKLEVKKQEQLIDEDPLLIEAIEIGIENNKISTSMLQRKLRIGFNRATTIIEQLEEKGWVSKSLGNNKGREILVTRYEIFGGENDVEQTRISELSDSHIIE